MHVKSFIHELDYFARYITSRAWSQAANGHILPTPHITVCSRTFETSMHSRTNHNNNDGRCSNPGAVEVIPGSCRSKAKQ